ncbi:proline--tRNA ligase [Halolamina litorea]|uniref:proline--tRNA ligase n=1 Tax=Halolamina litorea TaxID=1515593 RepID=A0ABD6BQJ9_9EURY|nr:aminoacyl--tRNA ligase-related protein [Halolamina litorea]
MRRSDLFLPASRERRGEWVGATRLLVRAGLIREFGSGLWGLTPAGQRVKTKIEARVHDAMRSVGAQAASLPNLQYSDRWRESGRWGAFEGEMFTFRNREDRAMCLAPSHEEGVVHLLDGLVRSYDDLPVVLYQIDSKFRDDHARAGLLRCKEFTMKDAYSAHVDADSLREAYRTMRAAYLRIFDDLGLTIAVCGADNSVMGGDRSEEFVAPVDEGSCRLTHCSADGCRWGVTDEAAEFDEYAASDDCPDCGGRLATDGGVEVGHVFELGTRYTDAIGLTVDDRDGGTTTVEMGSYGIGVTRLLQTIVMQGAWERDGGSDAESLDWPVTDWGSVAPYRAAVVPIGDDDAVRETATGIHDAIGADCLLFDDDQSVGERFAESDLLGVPATVVVGNHYRETGEVEIERKDGETRSVTPESVPAAVERFATGD